MQVSVEDRLTGVSAGVEDQPVARLQPFGFGDLCCGGDKRGHGGRFSQGQLGRIRQMRLRDEQDVSGRLWADISETEDQRAVVDDLRGDLPRHDAAEQTIGLPGS